MTREELKFKIQDLVRQVYGPRRAAAAYGEAESDELTKFPELREILVKLLTDDFKVFVDTIDWVAPKPTTFRINLKNGQSFYLIYTLRSWIAQVEGKKYYLLNLNELENGTNAISRVLRYGIKAVEGEETETKPSTPSKPKSSSSTSSTPSFTPTLTPAETPPAPEEETPAPEEEETAAA